MSDEFFLSVVAPLIFLATGIALLAGAARHRGKTLAFLAVAGEAAGEVVALERVPGRGADDAETWAPVVEFTARRGRRVRFTSMASSNPPAHAVGDSVRVLYEADRPEQARLRSFHDLWFMPSLLGGLGLAFFAVGAGLLVFGVLA